jgi:DNA-binding CsgD family transcriptional regulator
MLFTPREQAILHLVADLHPRAEIIESTGLSPYTINTYLGRLYEKAEVHSLLQLARYALENGYGSRVARSAVPQESDSQAVPLTGKDIHKAFVTVYPHVQPNWYKLIRLSKETYESVARELNKLTKERREREYSIPTHRH